MLARHDFFSTTSSSSSSSVSHQQSHSIIHMQSSAPICIPWSSRHIRARISDPSVPALGYIFMRRYSENEAEL